MPRPEVAAALAEAERSIAAGRLDLGAAAWRRAAAAAPADPEVPHRVAEALTRAGRPGDALSLRVQAYRLAPGEVRYRHALARALPGASLGGASPAVVEALLRLLQADDVSPQEVAPSLLGLLLARPPLPELLRLPDLASLQRALPAPPVQGLLHDPVWLALLTRALMTFGPLERFLTLLRRAALQRLAAGGGPAWLIADDPGPLAALACQAHHGAHAWDETQEEVGALASLPESGPLGPALLLRAAYRPLPTGAGKAERPADPWLALAQRRLVLEPRRQADLAAALPGLTPVEGETTCSVRQQYEENPYPRWLATTRLPPRPLAEVVRAVVPGVPAGSLPGGSLPAGPLEVLVAGCGTGQHAVRVASRYAGARVLALDLSRRSLGYAALRAEELGLTNLRFAQADLLALGSLAQRFHLVECVGVLHHLAEPLAGWRVLRGLLRPGGLMRIGLYSRLGRRHLDEARALAGLPAGVADPAALRQARGRIRAAAGTTAADAAMRGLDFYDLDGLRDLLFHVQETSYDCRRIAAELADLDLEFLGFEMPDQATLPRFRRRFPDPAALRDLAAWEAYEGDNPDSFAGMYLFWCRPRAPQSRA